MRRAEGEPTFLVGFEEEKNISISFTSTLGLPESERGNKKGKKKGAEKKVFCKLRFLHCIFSVLKRSFWEIALF